MPASAKRTCLAAGKIDSYVRFVADLCTCAIYSTIFGADRPSFKNKTGFKKNTGFKTYQNLRASKNEKKKRPSTKKQNLRASKQKKSTGFKTNHELKKNKSYGLPRKAKGFKKNTGLRVRPLGLAGPQSYRPMCFRSICVLCAGAPLRPSALAGPQSYSPMCFRTLCVFCAGSPLSP